LNFPTNKISSQSSQTSLTFSLIPFFSPFTRISFYIQSFPN